MIDLKAYFHDKYQGGEDFIENVILPIFGENKYEDAFEEDILENNPDLISMADSIGISQILRLGTINIPMNPTDVFDISVCNHVQMERNRVTIQQLVRRIMSTYSSAFMVFHYDDDTRWDWRFTFCSKQGNNQESTDSKRYTFLLGPNQSCRTAAENFKKLADKHGKIELADIVDAFDVESLSDEFFQKYKVRYGRFVGHVIGKEYVDKGEGKGEWKEVEGLTPSELFYGLGGNEKLVRDYIKKLLGRIVFLHFLQKKGWLGATNEMWTDGPQDFMFQLFTRASLEQKENFLDEILEPLFSCLDTPLTERSEVYDTKVDGLHSVRVPFLGGLFERTDEDKAISIFPSQLFADFFQFLSEYNFTIDENDPNDAKVGVDPEMLGRIFENLLEDNKDKGAFYTPKYIVQFMCRESLISYLQTGVSDEYIREALSKFVKTHDVEALGGRDSNLAKKVSNCLKDVKICDPAIGSGAFPMGLLNELFLCRGVIEDFSNAAEIKRHIIQQNIYGVDIEKGAVEIARLRFWLSLITDADKPDVLPNMDFKIMQGNSLLEQYKGFDLSHIMSKNTEFHAGYQYQMFENQVDVIRAEVKHTIDDYYNEISHDKRRLMRRGIQQKIQQQMSAQCVNVDISDINDIASNEQFFLWHTWFSEVFENNGGFDIVIGNPPYIRHEKLDIDYKHLLCSIYPNVGEGTADILVYFFGLGISILARKGILSFITSNKFLKTKYGKSLRNTLARDVDVLSFIDFFELPVFNNASTDAGITLLRKDNPISETKYYPVLSLKNLDLDNLIKGIYQHTIKTETEWQFIRPEEHSILTKLNIDSIPLTTFVNNRIYSGVKTGLNGTFMLSKEVRKMILSNCVTEDELRRTDKVIKKAFRSRDIRKYVYGGPQIWLLFIPWHFPIPFEEAEKMKPQIALSLAEDRMKEEYPALYAYLCAHKEELSDRNKDETGKRYEWYALQRWGANYFQEFDEEKLIYIHTAKNHEFYYDTEQHYVNNSCYIIASQSKFLYCFLNSKLFSYFKRIKFVAYGNGAEDGRCKLDGNKMATVPIKSNVDEGLFEEKYQKLQNIIKSNRLADTTVVEHEINQLIYQLYDLTKEEIAIVEGTYNN